MKNSKGTRIGKKTRVEEALRASEERFRSVFENASAGILIADANRNYLAVNERFCEITGYTRKQLLTKGCGQIVHPDDQLSDKTDVARLVRGEASSFIREMRYVHATGATVWVRANVSIVRSERPGDAQLIAVVEDITERKRAEEALRASEERFRRCFELGLVGMTITSPAKGFVEVNDEICRIFGYERGELLQKTWAELTHPDDLEADVTQFNRVMSGGDRRLCDRQTVPSQGRPDHRRHHLGKGHASRRRRGNSFFGAFAGHHRAQADGGEIEKIGGKIQASHKTCPQHESAGARCSARVIGSGGWRATP